MQDFLETYGYFALVFGTFFEGETAILVASSLSYSGLFFGPYTIIFGFLGSFISDWLYFLIGRFNGEYFIARRPKLQARIEPVRAFYLRNRLEILFSYRFLYGFRILLPLLIGMSERRLGYLLLYSVAAGLLWASTVALIGYIAGALFELTPQSFEEHVGYIILGFAAFGLSVGFIVHRFANRKMGI
ncbi:MAG: DedA family protein [Cyclobacteriaceae bacterium]|jgi:membrane protein DedA with SNARE-associated domain|nr:DedA family protein [Cyclobacteriaceae bacterium]